MIKIKKSFDLESTITCGQIFRYEKNEDYYIIIIKDRVLKLNEDGNNIVIESNNENNLLEVVNSYFDLKRDYNSLGKRIISKDKKMKDAVEYSKGMRIIRQDPFETIISYIISQNNRVPSIANALNLISNKYGKKVMFENREYYLFPSIEELKRASKEDLRACKVGFRDEYLYSAIQNMYDNNFDINSINEMNSAEALKYLMKNKGIGMKVASCILLFAYQRFDVYPVDTWVKKYMLEDYNITGEKNIREFTNQTYGDYSGLAIQYMFNYKRNKR